MNYKSPSQKHLVYFSKHIKINANYLLQPYLVNSYLTTCLKVNQTSKRNSPSSSSLTWSNTWDSTDSRKTSSRAASASLLITLLIPTPCWGRLVATDSESSLKLAVQCSQSMPSRLLTFWSKLFSSPKDLKMKNCLNTAETMLSVHSVSVSNINQMQFQTHRKFSSFGCKISQSLTTMKRQRSWMTF